jgi:hypothetical protein
MGAVVVGLSLQAMVSDESESKTQESALLGFILLY